MAVKKMTGGSKSVKKTKTMPKAAKLMGAPASARQPKAKSAAPTVAKNMGAPASARQKAGKMRSTGSAKTTTVSRGSNTRKQVEDMNQREWFNAQRDVKQKRSKSGNIIGSTIPGFKVSKAMADLEGFDVADERKRQRAGGGLTRKNVNQSSSSLKSASKPKAKGKR
jgi:hypothetical protein